MGSKDLESNLEKLILELFEIKVLKFGNFKLKSGIDSPVYLDLRVIVSYPKLMDLLANLLVDLIKTSDVGKFEHICGVPYTALPMATLVSAKSGTPMLIRRKEAKDYGLKKMIEGNFDEGDRCIIIEDVVSSGSSIVETVEDLEKAGLKANCAVIVLDRQQGGVKNLEERGIKVFVLSSLTKVLKILHRHGKITQETVNDVEQYLSNTKANLVGTIKTSNESTNQRLKLRFSARAQLSRNKMTGKIFNLMEQKKSLLCLAADVTKSSQLLKLASQVGPHICILKTHFDALEDFSQETYSELVRLSKNLNFLIMEDRKFSDIGNTVSLQYNQIKAWADLVTAHSIAGEGILKGLKCCVEGNANKGCFLVAELSCDGQLINKQYTSATYKMAENHEDFVVGLVCQSGDVIKVPHLIQLTPGVKIEEGSDNLGQNYNDPEMVVLEKGADIAVVGRGIISSSDPEKAAVIYKEKLWNAYEKRVKG